MSDPVLLTGIPPNIGSPRRSRPAVRASAISRSLVSQVTRFLPKSPAAAVNPARVSRNPFSQSGFANSPSPRSPHVAPYRRKALAPEATAASPGTAWICRHPDLAAAVGRQVPRRRRSRNRGPRTGDRTSCPCHRSARHRQRPHRTGDHRRPGPGAWPLTGYARRARAHCRATMSA
jgi:hypothetical protein